MLRQRLQMTIAPIGVAAAMLLIAPGTAAAAPGIDTGSADSGSSSGSAVLESLTGILGGLATGSTDGTARPDITGEWVGTWNISDGSYPAYLTVDRSDSMLATITIPSRPCTARWTESYGSGTTVTVDADVVSGSCFDNRWHLTLTDTSILGVDSQDQNVSVRLTRR